MAPHFPNEKLDLDLKLLSFGKKHETCYTSPCCWVYDLYDDPTKDSYHLQSLIDRNLCALVKDLKGQSDCKDVKFYHFIG